MKRILLFVITMLGVSACSKDDYKLTYINTNKSALAVIDREEAFSEVFLYTHPVKILNIMAQNSFDEEPQMLTYFVRYNWREDHDFPWEMKTRGVSVVQTWHNEVEVKVSPNAPYAIYHINVKPQSGDIGIIIPNQICIIRK